MLVKLPDESPDFVEKLKEQTGATTAAGAYRFAAERYGSLTYQLKQAMDELARLQTRQRPAADHRQRSRLCLFAA
ncbi:hypothetical protein [Pseudomonas aeruginosa]|uniref:hypothetical protein n=1 Tax=Pseudomonas aeruginosa TaxID=287 RepID=UPI0024BFFB27|nr:hypothetical protein [Pseudomonas aeruginosa]WHV74019.1 hypothetical protein M2I95_16170 [Pseudomonas aeruginosa]